MTDRAQSQRGASTGQQGARIGIARQVIVRHARTAETARRPATSDRRELAEATSGVCAGQWVVPRGLENWRQERVDNPRVLGSSPTGHPAAFAHVRACLNSSCRLRLGRPSLLKPLGESRHRLGYMWCESVRSRRHRVGSLPRFHLMEQPMLARWGSGTDSPARTRRAATASRSPVTGLRLPGEDSSNAPR